MQQKNSNYYLGPVATQFVNTETGKLRTKKPVIQYDHCKLCMNCAMYCGCNVIEKVDEKLTIDYRYCKGCGVCANVCSQNAIVMEKEGDIDEA